MGSLCLKFPSLVIDDNVKKEKKNVGKIKRKVLEQLSINCLKYGNVNHLWGVSLSHFSCDIALQAFVWVAVQGLLEWPIFGYIGHMKSCT